MGWWIAGFVLLLFVFRAFIRIASPAHAVLEAQKRIRNYPPDRLGLKDLIERLDLSGEDVENFAAPVYREVKIPKRGGGVRTLEIPDQQTLVIQRRILQRVLNGLACHDAAVGFEQGRSIVDAARPHVNKKIVIRIDIRRFFESTKAERITEWLRSIGWDANAAAVLTTMMTCQGHLPQGAATSPRLSNLVNARLDQGLQNLADTFNGDYTRYADDITLSFNLRSGRRIRGIIQVVRRILKQAGYEMHGRKTRVLRKHQRQQVLGLTVNSKVAIPRHIRRRLRAARHRVATGGSATLTAAQLQGWDSYERMVAEQSSEV